MRNLPLILWVLFWIMWNKIMGPCFSITPISETANIVIGILNITVFFVPLLFIGSKLYGKKLFISLNEYRAKQEEGK